MVVLICPTAQGKMCTTGILRMASMRIARNSLRVIASASEAIQERSRGNSLDCFVALLLAMTTSRLLSPAESVAVPLSWPDRLKISP
jgi:hypothetical protein